MAATPTEINNFKATIQSKQSEIGNTITNILSINGRAENEEILSKFKLINIYGNILIDYFSQDPYNTYNFFTTDEIWDIVQHFNELCNTDYSIDL
jgi:hypothetical protein